MQQAAPIMRWAEDKPVSQVRQWCARKGHEMTALRHEVHVWELPTLERPKAPAERVAEVYSIKSTVRRKGKKR